VARNCILNLPIHLNPVTCDSIWIQKKRENGANVSGALYYRSFWPLQTSLSPLRGTCNTSESDILQASCLKNLDTVMTSNLQAKQCSLLTSSISHVVLTQILTETPTIYTLVLTWPGAIPLTYTTKNMRGQGHNEDICLRQISTVQKRTCLRVSPQYLPSSFKLQTETRTKYSFGGWGKSFLTTTRFGWWVHVPPLLFTAWFFYRFLTDTLMSRISRFWGPNTWHGAALLVLDVWPRGRNRSPVIRYIEPYVYTLWQIYTCLLSPVWVDMWHYIYDATRFIQDK